MGAESTVQLKEEDGDAPAAVARTPMGPKEDEEAEEGAAAAARRPGDPRLPRRRGRGGPRRDKAGASSARLQVYRPGALVASQPLHFEPPSCQTWRGGFVSSICRYCRCPRSRVRSGKARKARVYELATVAA